MNPGMPSHGNGMDHPYFHRQECDGPASSDMQGSSHSEIGGPYSNRNMNNFGSDGPRFGQQSEFLILVFSA